MTKEQKLPWIPETEKQLGRAIALLGNRVKAESTPKVRAELESLIGIYPTEEQAATWKSKLKAIRKQRQENAL